MDRDKVLGLLDYSTSEYSESIVSTGSSCDDLGLQELIELEQEEQVNTTAVEVWICTNGTNKHYI